MTRRILFLFVCFLSAAPAQTPAQQYRETAARLIDAAVNDPDGWKKLEYLCYRIGHRQSNSEAYREAVKWAVAAMQADGLEAQALPVKVPNWVRGRESAEMVAPVRAPLAMLGLGGSVGTPEEGITAEVVAVSSFDELEKLGAEKVRGKMVLYDVEWRGYGPTVAYRTAGAARAAKLGAVAALVRSMGPVSLRTPHTGATVYAEGVPKIPAAALALEDVRRLRGLLGMGETVRVTLRMEAKWLPDADSSNVVADLKGREKPEEVVVVGGHFDSWDVGQGAHDDGASCIAAWQAVALMKKLGLQPRRTVRVVLWTDEELTGAGGKAYREWVGSRIKNHVAAIEMDGGAEKPAGFGYTGPGDSFATARQIVSLLDPIGAGDLRRGGGGADIAPLMRDGVPGFGHRTSGGRYFEWHHTPADTLDKVDPLEFRQNVATLAVLAYVLADMPQRLGD